MTGGPRARILRLRPRSLSARLTLLVTVGALLVLTVSLSLLYAALVGQVQASVDQGLRARATDLAASLEPGELKIPAQEPLAQLYDQQGAVLSSSPSLAPGAGLLPATVLTGPVADERLLDVPDPHDEDDEIRVLVQPVRVRGQVLLVAVGASQGPLENARERLLVVLLIAGPLLLAAVAVAARLLTSAALRPVGTLTAEAEAIAAAGSPRRLTPVPGDDEVAHLAGTLDRMLQRLAVAFERERAFVDDAAHELRTPITVLRGELELALAARDDPREVEQSLHAAYAEADRLARLAEDLLVLARERAGALTVDRQPVDVHELAARTARRLQPVTGALICCEGAPVVLEADPARLEQVLSNLIMNSAGAGARAIRVCTEPGDRSARLCVEDDGPGFPPELLPAALERFTRGDAARTRGAVGAGLGLAIAAAIVRAHRGTIGVGNDSRLGGARVVITLPRTVEGGPASA